MIQDAGKFDARIIVQKHGEPATIIAGEPVPTWVEHYQTWAKRMPLTSQQKEQVEAMSMTSSDMCEFWIRYPKESSMPSTKMQVVEARRGSIYNIENIRIEGRNQYLILVCKQRQQL